MNPSHKVPPSQYAPTPTHEQASPAGDCVIRRIRVKSVDSAFVYAILESHEGIASYSTLKHQPGDPHRDLELSIPRAFVGEVNDVLARLARQTGDGIYDLE